MHCTYGATPGVQFLHNGDFSGDVIVQLNDVNSCQHIERFVFDGNEIAPMHWEVRIPFADMQRIVATWLKRREVAALEEASDEEVLLREY